jgi:hypothetical protein
MEKGLGRMTIFNKLIAFLTVMSFLASDNIYAAPHRDDLGDRTRGVRKTQLKNPVKNIRPAAKGTPRRAPNLRLKAELEKTKKLSLQNARGRKNIPAPKKLMERKRPVKVVRPPVRPVQNNAQKRMNIAKAAQPKLASALNSSTKNANVAKALQHKAALAQKDAQKNGNVARAPQHKAALAQKDAQKNGNVARTPQHTAALAQKDAQKNGNVARAPQHKAALAQKDAPKNGNVARGPQPSGKKPIQAPVKDPRKTPAKGPQYYVLKAKHLPKDLQKDLEVFGLEKDEEITIKEHKLRKELKDMEAIEAAAPGITERAHQYLSSIGYNPNGAGKVRIVLSKLPKEFKDMMEMFAENDFPAIISLSQADVTEMLNDVRECEALLRNKPGFVGRLRSFLKKQYGFQG